ncbi:ThiF family adenylyltransferase [Rhodanobacter denitrificans]|uniref:ThiF family adenylyltransferase n=1 Tax=Rhodanobacter denitrificans TaxID=666685 RepID=A0A368KLJ5_9GAMM|nr:ThiF family adenylyltransferase [Rhodanobacter denitrificans]RCS31573.1 ThiF family adenylyltransferase [Rhodanobacter denitrificans]
MRLSLRMTEEQHQQLLAHLHPGDGKEAAAWLLCGRRRDDDRGILCARAVFPISHEATSRKPHQVTWRIDSLHPLLEAAQGLDSPAIVHFHSHPAGANAFSRVDDESDRVLHADLAKIYEDGLPMASAVMLPNGEIFGRTWSSGVFEPLDGIFVIGDRIRRFSAQEHDVLKALHASHRQALGGGTTALLGKLRIAVVGCSGTGSIVIELLARLGVKELILIDPDHVEDRNLNRIVNSTWADARMGTPKVEALARKILSNLGTDAPRIIPEHGTLAEAWRVAATADIVFGCTDSAEARMHLDRLCHYYVMPYIDVGVDLRADEHDGIRYAGMAVHYLRPGGDSLLSRRGYRMSVVEAETLRRTNPELYAERVKTGYIEGVEEERPAVISINMQGASMAVNELLARLHGFRAGSPDEHAFRRVNLVEEFQTTSVANGPCPVMSPLCGLGDATPPLGLAGLT